MSLIDLIIVAFALSMDAFAVAVCTGLTIKKATLIKMLIVGIYFGVFQAVMPVIGYLTAALFAERIVVFNHWIAFVLLCFLGGKMIYSCIKNSDCKVNKQCRKEEDSRSCLVCELGEGENSRQCEIQEISLTPLKMLPLAIATSIDALAVGVSFAFLQVSIVPAAVSIGVITLLLSMLGVKIGNIFGVRFKSKAELVGGVILIIIGFRILFEYLEVISF